jgi:hypothetical protein
MKQKLTNNQLGVLCFLRDYFRENDQIPPAEVISFSYLGAKTHNAGFESLKALAKKGYIERNANGKFRFTREAPDA